ncbi:SWI/SNF chromatin-remodeling complex subunit, partial [Ascosphaera pollenicola]
MVNCGVAYAYAYNGPICLFLKIDPSNVKTLYVHAISQPLDEEGHQALPQENIKDTICAKLLTLLTLARNSGPLSSNWVKRSLKTLKSKVPASSDLGIYVSAHAQYPGSPEKPMYADDYRKPEAFYCSQACLLGLQVKGQLDEECPNCSLHRQGNDTMKHCVNARQVTEMTRLQLSDDLDHNVSTLGLDFAYTVSYKITVNNYGYTFRAKGVVEGSHMSLGYEAGLYDMLQDEQGDTIPVHIGYFHLNKDEGVLK